MAVSFNEELEAAADPTTWNPGSVTDGYLLWINAVLAPASAITFSNWDHGATALTELLELDQGSGANHSSIGVAGAALGTVDPASGDLDVDHSTGPSLDLGWACTLDGADQTTSIAVNTGIGYETTDTNPISTPITATFPAGSFGIYFMFHKSPFAPSAPTGGTLTWTERYVVTASGNGLAVYTAPAATEAVDEDVAGDPNDIDFGIHGLIIVQQVSAGGGSVGANILGGKLNRLSLVK